MSSLRGHHLICLHFFKGEGYDTVFVENLKHVIDRANREGVMVQRGVDDVCHACQHLEGSECNYRAGNEDEIKRLDALALRLLNLEVGAEGDWGDLEKMLPRTFHEWKSRACEKCDWLSTCRSTYLWKRLDSL
jgi:hypothetical protein